jgi:hypothetical protein
MRTAPGSFASAAVEQSRDQEAAEQDQRNENEAPSDEEMSEFDPAHLGCRQRDTDVCEVRRFRVDLGQQLARGFRPFQPLSHLLFDRAFHLRDIKHTGYDQEHGDSKTATITYHEIVPAT